MLPTDTFFQRWFRSQVIMYFWGMRIGMVIAWCVAMYYVLFAREYIDWNFVNHDAPTHLFPGVLVALIPGAPFFLWVTRDVRF